MADPGGWGGVGTATDARDQIKQIVDDEIEALRPAPKYGVVQQLDKPNFRAQVIYVGDPPDNPIWLPMTGIQPTLTGQVVRIDGPPGDRMITAVMGKSHLAEAVQIAAPANFTLSTTVDYTYPNIVATWTPGDLHSADAYMVQYRPVGVTNFETRYTAIGQTDIRLYPLAKNTQYEVRITALGAAGGTSLTVSSFITTSHDVTAPAAPATPTVAPAFAGFRVTWTDNSEPDVKNGYGQYRLQVASDSGFTTTVVNKVVAGTGTTVNGLSDGTTYWLRLYARDTDGNESLPSTVVSATTLVLTSGQIPTIPGTKLHDGSPPASSPAANVTSGPGYLYVYWTAVANNDPVTYEIHLSTTSGFTPSGATKVTEVSNGLQAFVRNLPGTSTALAYGTTYYIKIIAKDLDGAAAAGTQASGSPVKIGGGDILSVPGNLVHDGSAPASSPTPTVVGGIGYLYASWAAATNNDPVTYEVHLSTTTGFTPSGATKVTEVSDLQAFIRTLPGTTTPLGYGTTYYVKIIAKDLDGAAAASAQASGTPVFVQTGDVGTIGGQQVKDGTAPPSSPTPTLTGGIGYLYASWSPVANNDPVTYEVHLSTTTGFTPSGATKVGETSSLFAFIRTLPGTSTPLTYATTYYVRLVAKDLDGSAAAGTQASAAPVQTTGADLAVNSIIAGSGIIANGAIGNAQISDLDAGKVNAGILAAARLGAGSIDTSKLLVNPGGGNLAQNSNLQRGDANNWALGTGAGTVAFSATHSLYGSPGSLKLTATAAGNISGRQRLFNVFPGDVITAQGQFFCGSVARNGHLIFNWFDSGGVQIGASVLGTQVLGTLNAWTPVPILTATAPAGTFELRVHIEITSVATTDNNWVGGLMVQRGDLYSSWTPAVEEIMPGTIIGEMIAANAIVAGSAIIQDGAISNAKISSLDAGKINTGYLDVANRVQAGAILTEKLSVANFGANAIPNGGFEDVSVSNSTRAASWLYDWQVAGSGATYDLTGAAPIITGNNSLRFISVGAGAGLAVASAAIPVSAGDKWYISMLARSASSNPHGLYFRAYFGTTPTFLRTDSGVTLLDIIPADSPWPFTTSSAIVEGQVTVPVGVTWMRVAIFAWTNTTATYNGVIDDVIARKVVNTVQIADGAITAPKVITHLIQAGSVIIDSAAIDYTQIGSVDAGTISVGYLDVINRVQANAIDASKLLVWPGGGNKVRNSIFGTGDFSYWAVNGAGWHTRSGVGGIVDHAGTSDVYCQRSDTSNTWQSLTSNRFNVTGGGKLSVRFLYYLSNHVKQSHLKINFYTTTNTVISSVFPLGGTDNVSGVDGPWTKVEKTGANAFVIPNNAATAEVQLMGGWSSLAGSNATTYFASLMVSAGDLMGDWVPSPEEITPGTFATDIALVSGSISSTSFLSGSYGWQINADGTAEFVNVIITGTLKTNSVSGWLTATSGGGFRTAASGARIEISSTYYDSMKFYSGSASETTPGALAVSGGSAGTLSLVSPQYNSLAYWAALNLYSGATTISASVRLQALGSTSLASAISGFGGSYIEISAHNIQFTSWLWRAATTFYNSWVNYGSGWRGASFAVVGAGVRMSGLVKSGSNGNAFAIPLSAMWPTYDQIFTAAGFGGNAEIRVLASGVVSITCNAGVNGYVSLDGIEYVLN